MSLHSRRSCFPVKHTSGYHKTKRETEMYSQVELLATKPQKSIIKNIYSRLLRLQTVV